ncbi:Soluble NSF attachment protein alpha isoform [Balamuthia mandrillaris]
MEAPTNKGGEGEQAGGSSSAQFKRGNELMEQAEKASKGSWWANLFGGSATLRKEEAAETFSKAGNLFKLSKNWEAATKAYLRSAETHLEAGSSHEATAAYINAATSCKKHDKTASIKYLERAIAIFVEDGRFSIAAKHQKEIAEMYEEELEKEAALQNYQTAADYFEGEGSHVNARGCLLKVAIFSAELGQYEKAIQIFEDLASQSQDGLSKWNIKEYLLKAGICRLAQGDLVAARKALNHYKDTYLSFAGEREFKLLDDITNAYENYDVEAFTTAVAEYDRLSTFDSWYTSLLVKIKKAVSMEDENDEEPAEDGESDLTFGVAICGRWAWDGVLSVLFLILAFVSLFILLRNIRSPWGWQKIFHVMLFLGSFIRGLFFALQPFIREGKMTCPNQVNIMLNSLPSFFFFSTYILLLFFWVELIYTTIIQKDRGYTSLISPPMPPKKGVQLKLFRTLYLFIVAVLFTIAVCTNEEKRKKGERGERENGDERERRKEARSMTT